LSDFKTKSNGWFGPGFCTVVEVETENGVIGTATAGAFNGAAKNIIDMYMVDLIKGQDIENHEGNWQRIYRTLIRFGRSGAAVSALSAIDTALWDAHARELKTPIAQLLGGNVQDRVPCYVSRLYAMDDLDELAQEAVGYINQGFTRLKQRFGFGPTDGYAGMKRNVDLIRTVREAVGPDVEIAADAYMSWDFGYAIEMSKRLREYNLSWIEEPLMPQLVHRYAELRKATPGQRWSCGEHSYTKWDFEELIRNSAVDILQPDFNRAGGLTEARKICALAETAGLPVFPHSNEAHNTAIIFSQSAAVCPVVEYFPNVLPDTGNELFWQLFSGYPEAKDGYLAKDTRPGLGIELNQDLASELAVENDDWVEIGK
jgi:L-alanine-DL-glutamate epimerase-like enolase superfamily enzyme